MKSVKAYPGQSMLDVSLMACGTADYAADIAAANGLTVDAVVSDVKMLQVPTVSARVSGEMERAGVVPVSGGRWMRDGIGMMEIGTDFIVD